MDMNANIDRVRELERDYAEAQHQIGEYVDKTAELQAENERLRGDLEHRGRIIANINDHHTRLQEKHRDAVLFLRSTLFNDGEAGSRLMEILSPTAAVQEDTCTHEWCDIATGGQYCRLCDARRSELEDSVALRTANELAELGNSEGWCLSYSTDYGLCIEKDDEQAVFKWDDDAIAFDAKKARDGSRPHLTAMQIHVANSHYYWSVTLPKQLARRHEA
jgi:regulator of replication initiation timing